MKASSVLIVVAVIVAVAGVAWFRSAREGTSADPPAPAVSPTAAKPTPTPDAAPPKEGALCPEPPPAAQPASAPAPVAMADPIPAHTRPAPPTNSAATIRPAPASMPAPDASPVAASSAPAKKLPRIVDLGADKCIPCKKLAPILEELKKEYAGRVIVDFIDVWKDPKAGEPYKFRVIPTQIFFDRDGTEMWRHEGFLPKEDFIAKFKELGVK